ncbi:hypothetical protein TIFTF001_020054 [Ficus carica]|uniref:Uncharacterized protein n=1 Tax=Ficus carica TaxID=3494 RepID=A0AA88DJI8_FICCA|nr:hypothetical protein TIFTF001_020054 [Ficus carica]
MPNTFLFLLHRPKCPVANHDGIANSYSSGSNSVTAVLESFSAQTPRPSADNDDLSSIASANSTVISVFNCGTKWHAID